MKNITTSNDMYIQGYGTVKAGTKLHVTKFNSRYIYTYINAYCTLRLAYSDTTAKPPKRKHTANKPIKDETEKTAE